MYSLYYLTGMTNDCICCSTLLYSVLYSDVQKETQSSEHTPGICMVDGYTIKELALKGNYRGTQKQEFARASMRYSGMPLS